MAPIKDLAGSHPKKSVLKSILKSRATSSFNPTPNSSPSSNSNTPQDLGFYLDQEPAEPTVNGFAAQSLELIKIALHVTIATLFFARGLLPAFCFSEGKIQKPRFGPRPKIFSYEQFIQNDLSSEELEGLPFATALMKIKRGVDQSADGILHLLEDGIFNALVRRQIRAVQFTVLENMMFPNRVLECYTITLGHIGWLGGSDRSLRSSAVELDDPKDQMKSTDELKKSLGSMIRTLITLSTSFPKLPRDRSIGLNMIFFPTCPPGYQPPGFAPSYTDYLLFPIHHGWEKVTRTCGEFNTGFHAAKLRVSYMQRQTYIDEGSSITKSLLAQLQLGQPILPANMEFRDPIQRGTEIVTLSQDLQSPCEEESSDDSSEDTPTERLRDPDGKTEYKQLHLVKKGRLMRRTLKRRDRRRKGQKFVFTKPEDAEAGLLEAQKRAMTRARWLNGETNEDYEPDEVEIKNKKKQEKRARLFAKLNGAWAD